MDRLAALTVFAKVVEQGSFARAAGRLGLSPSAVSRHVADLEAHLGARLLNRTTRRLSLTESGRAFHERAVQLLADLEEAEAAVGAQALAPRGTLKLTCPITFGERYLAPAIAAFAALHPQLAFEIDLSDRTVDIVDEGYDLAVRIGAVGSTALIARPIGRTQLVCCAAPAYVARHGVPAAPEDLARHACLAYAYLADRGAWRFTDARGEERVAKVAGPLGANNGRFLAEIAATGLAIALEPDFIVGDDIRAGRLVQLLPGFRPPSSPIYAVYPSRRHLSAKVRLFVEFLIARFAGEAPWGLVQAPPGGARGLGPSRPRRTSPRRAG